MRLKMAIDLDVHELLFMGDSDLLIRQAQGEWETGVIKLIPYRQCVQDLSKRFKSIEFRYIPRFHNELVDALATLASMLPYPGNTHIDPLEIQVRNQHGYCNTIETEPDGEPWYHDIKRFLKTREYPEHAKGDQKRTIRRLASGFFLNGEILYKRTPDLNLLRCIDATEAERIMSEVHSGVCGPHLNGYVLAKKILRIEDTEWVKTRLEQLMLIDEKRLAAVCFGQLYQQRMARTYNKKVRPRRFEIGQLVLRRILPHQDLLQEKVDKHYGHKLILGARQPSSILKKKCIALETRVVIARTSGYETVVGNNVNPRSLENDTEQPRISVPC
ncbi:PREDICTED: uncharacterized protein LOC109226116 [Nicotiana attenuata]|uniref:uncharacterized protein LOC109226116 n=1 Tax=Nicotiana attenuata TaxID=49451 RepID=UPI000905AABD|nr:PREDICTED: uncharacterized protein LOC109226116 [Nicotiana attenuata]